MLIQSKMKFIEESFFIRPIPIPTQFPLNIWKLIFWYSSPTPPSTNTNLSLSDLVCLASKPSLEREIDFLRLPILLRFHFFIEAVGKVFMFSSEDILFFQTKFNEEILLFHEVISRFFKFFLDLLTKFGKNFCNFLEIGGNLDFFLCLMILYNPCNPSDILNITFPFLYLVLYRFVDKLIKPHIHLHLR